MSDEGGNGGLTYHYSRSDRLKMGGHDLEAPKKKGSIFNRNRSLAIVLIDIALIVVIYIIFSLVFNTEPTSESYGGYNFSLRAVAFADEVLCTVRVTQQEPEEGVAGVPATVRFSSGGGSAETIDLLPTGNTSERLFRARLQRSEAANEVRATVEIGDHSFTIETQVVEE